MPNSPGAEHLVSSLLSTAPVAPICPPYANVVIAANTGSHSKALPSGARSLKSLQKVLLGVSLERHCWHSRRGSPSRPDWRARGQICICFQATVEVAIIAFDWWRWRCLQHMDVKVIFNREILKASELLCLVFVNQERRVIEVDFWYQLCIICKHILPRTSECVYWEPGLAVTSCQVSDVTEFVVQSAEKNGCCLENIYTALFFWVLSSSVIIVTIIELY